MSAAKSVITRLNRNGESEGLLYTPRDLDFIKFTARWWCTSLDLFLRKTEDPGEWEPYYKLGENEDWRKRKYHSLRRRFNKLTELESYAPLTAGVVDAGKTAYWCTTSGAELVGAPWERYPNGNVSRAAHAWAACDMGIFLERHGIPVYSEREFATGETVSHLTIPGGKFVNRIDGSKSTNKDHGMRPDLAISTEDERFVLIEVERKVGRGMKEYKRKMESYFAHDRVAGLLYIAEDRATARNIKALHEELSPLKRDMPTLVLKLGINERSYASAPGLQSASCIELLNNAGVDASGLERKG